MALRSSTGIRSRARPAADSWRSRCSQSRYIEAAIDGIVIGCLYLPNGNAAPGPKFDYKLRWFERLHSCAAELLELDVPVALVGDFNVMPTDLDFYTPGRWRDDALFRPEVRAAYA